MAHRSRTKEPGPATKMAAVRAVADSTQERTVMQRKSTRRRKRAAFDADASDDSNQVSHSHARRIGKASKKGVRSNENCLLDQKEPMAMGRQIPLTFTAQGKTRCPVTAAESSTTLTPQTISATEVDSDKEDSNVLMREWLERKADKGNLPGLQWFDKARKLVKISWKHGSKSGWTASDSQVFISWARCTGQQMIMCDNTGFIFTARCNIYISAYAAVSVSVRLSVTEVNWHIIANYVSNSDPNLSHIVIVGRGHLNNDISHYASHC